MLADGKLSQIWNARDWRPRRLYAAHPRLELCQHSDRSENMTRLQPLLNNPLTRMLSSIDRSQGARAELQMSDSSRCSTLHRYDCHPSSTSPIGCSPEIACCIPRTVEQAHGRYCKETVLQHMTTEQAIACIPANAQRSISFRRVPVVLEATSAQAGRQVCVGRGKVRARLRAESYLELTSLQEELVMLDPASREWRAIQRGLDDVLVRLCPVKVDCGQSGGLAGDSRCDTPAWEVRRVQ